MGSCAKGQISLEHRTAYLGGTQSAYSFVVELIDLSFLC